MHTCRLKAGFPTIFEIMSAKCEGGCQVYLCLKIKFDILQKNLLVYTCRLKAVSHTRFVNF